MFWLCCFLWWLVGFCSIIFVVVKGSEKISAYDLLGIIVFGLSGPITLIIIGLCLLFEKLDNIVIWKHKK